MSDNSDDIKKEEGTPKVKRGDRSAQIKQINAEAAKNMRPGIQTGSNELKAAADTSLMGRLKSAGKNLKNNIKNTGIAVSNKVTNALNGQTNQPVGKVPGPKKAPPEPNSPESMAAFHAGKRPNPQPDRQAQMKEINSSILKPASSTSSGTAIKRSPTGTAIATNTTPTQTKSQGSMPMPGVNMKKDKLSKTQIEMLDLLKGQFSKLGKPGASEAAKAVMAAPITEAEQKHVGKPMAPASVKAVSTPAASAVVEKPSVAIPSEPVAAVAKPAPHEKLANHVAHTKTKNTLKSKGKAKVDAKPVVSASPVAAPSAPASAPVAAVAAKESPVVAKPAPAEQAHAKVKEVLKGKSKAKAASAQGAKSKVLTPEQDPLPGGWRGEKKTTSAPVAVPGSEKTAPLPAEPVAEKKFTPGAQKNLQSAPKSAEPAAVQAKPEAQRSFKSDKVLPKGSPANQKAVDAQSAKQKMDTEKTADFKEISAAKPDSWSSKGSPEKTEVTKDAKPAEVTAKPGTGTEVTAKPGSQAKPDVHSEVTAKPGEKPAPKKDVHSEETFKPGAAKPGASKPEGKKEEPKAASKSAGSNSSPNLGVKTTFVAPTAHGHVMNFLRQLFSPGAQPPGEGQQIANASQHFMQKSEEKTEKESIGATATKIKESAKKAPAAEKAKLLTTPENYPEHNRKKVLSLLKTCSMHKSEDDMNASDKPKKEKKSSITITRKPHSNGTHTIIQAESRGRVHHMVSADPVPSDDEARESFKSRKTDYKARRNWREGYGSVS